MNLIHKGDNGFWVMAAADAETYLGYPVGHFGQGYMIGRWSGVHTNRTFATLEEAIASEALVPDRTVERSTASNALGQHLSNLENDD